MLYIVTILETDNQRNTNFYHNAFYAFEKAQNNVIENMSDCIKTLEHFNTIYSIIETKNNDYLERIIQTKEKNYTYRLTIAKTF